MITPRHMRNGLGLLPVLLLCSACAQLGVEDGAGEDCGDVLEFHRIAAQLSPGAGAEMRRALQPRGAASDACNRLRLALLLARPDTGFRNDAEAARLLQAFLDDPAHARHPQRPLARLLADELAERQRLAAQVATLEESLAGERQRQQALSQNLQRLRADNAELRRQVQTQRSQLDQLKSIERDINAKERAVENPATPREEGGHHEPGQDSPGR